MLTDKTGLTGGLSRALATDRLLTHDRGRVLADLAWLESGDLKPASTARHGAARQPVAGSCRADLRRI